MASERKDLVFPIRIEHVLPPIPLRDFDYTAVDDNYEPGCPIGFGPTPASALADLMEQFDE